jgi:outer membrane protein OmpA-like peptidoglycan-associated protein
LFLLQIRHRKASSPTCFSGLSIGRISRSMSASRALALLLLPATLSACVTASGPTTVEDCRSRRDTATAVGALLGLGLGLAVGGDNKAAAAALGGVAGGAAGLAIGSYLEDRCVELVRAREAMTEGTIAWAEVDPPAQGGQEEKTGMLVAYNAPSMFAVGEAELGGAARDELTRLATVYREGTRKVLIVGHTDDTGPAVANQRLSERRAEVVARLFAAAGVPEERIYYRGAGESMPAVSNATPEGRARNRRVEVLEMVRETDLAAFEALRETRMANLTPPAEPSDAPAAVSTPVRAPAAAPAGGGTMPSAATDAVAGPATPTVVALRDGGIDLGGTPVDGVGTLASVVGERPDSGSEGLLGDLSFIGTAFARDEDEEEEVIPTGTACIGDEYKPLGVMRSLATGGAVSVPIRDHMPGLYGTSWVQTLNGSLVSLTKVRVLRNDAQPGGDPDVLVYRDYAGGNPAPDVSASGHVRTYKGDKGLLYRVFVDEADGWPLRCADIVFSLGNPPAVVHGALYYDWNRAVNIVPYHPHMASTH